MKLYTIFLCVLACSILAMGSLAVFSQTAESTADVQAADSAFELVHYGDVIDVDVLGGFDFDWRGTLTPEGFLEGMDEYTEPIYGLCRTENEIAAEIVKVLSRTLRDPKVVVRILDRSNRAVARLDGAVRTATRFQIKRTVRLTELLVMSGGLVDGASGEIRIFRPRDLSCRPPNASTPASGSGNESGQDNAASVINIKIADLLSGKPTANPLILSGDLITVDRALPIYVIGAVTNPRPVYSRDKMSLSRLIATAGGLAKEADGGKVFIFRRVGLEVRSIEADLTKIKNSESNDEILQPFDIIEVAAKGAGRRSYPPVTASNQIFDRSNRALPLRIVD